MISMYIKKISIDQDYLEFPLQKKKKVQGKVAKYVLANKWKTAAKVINNAFKDGSKEIRCMLTCVSAFSESVTLQTLNSIYHCA